MLQKYKDNDVDSQSLRTLRGLLDGEFKNGAGPGLYNNEAGATV